MRFAFLIGVLMFSVLLVGCGSGQTTPAPQAAPPMEKKPGKDKEADKRPPSARE